MAKLHKELLANDQEFELLSEMLLETEIMDGKEHKYDISCQSGTEGLLFQLGLADELQLVANYGDHHLVFPVQMEMGDFSNFSMAIKSPKIYEIGKKLRSWRLSADKTMSIVNEAGEILPYRVKDISTSGISLLIEENENTTLPKVLNNLYLQLPDRERLAICGSQIRRIDPHTIAYSLGNTTNDEVLTSLTEYLFECHALRHPEAHLSQIK